MRLLTLPWLRNCFSAFILMSVLSSAITSFAQTTTEQQGVTQNLSECNNSDILSLIGEPIEKLNISPATTPTNSGTNQVSLPQRKVSFSTSQSSNSAPSSTTSQVRNSDSNST